MVVLDYAAWNIFVAMAGGFAILYMAMLIILSSGPGETRKLKVAQDDNPSIHEFSPTPA